jgi:hypothetical protein
MHPSSMIAHPSRNIIVAQGLSILSHFPQGKDHKPVRAIMEETVDSSRPWAYFDGASQNDSQISGGGLSFIYPTHILQSQNGFGAWDKQLCRTNGIKTFIDLCWGKRINSLQIFGDSMVVINWIRKT